jgi:hypothetical protein
MADAVKNREGLVGRLTIRRQFFQPPQLTEEPTPTVKPGDDEGDES